MKKRFAAAIVAGTLVAMALLFALTNPVSTHCLENDTSSAKAALVDVFARHAASLFHVSAASATASLWSSIDVTTVEGPQMSFDADTTLYIKYRFTACGADLRRTAIYHCAGGISEGLPASAACLFAAE
ncbi:MAG: hypothetical protein ACRBB0_12375 [Pelagimonas sp.]|uniref:hypothetical protein n=1 Tax=Pelagimonas sp. TaxID=2073170 RepID=UPI003D6A0DB5